MEKFENILLVFAGLFLVFLVTLAYVASSHVSKVPAAPVFLKKITFDESLSIDFVAYNVDTGMLFAADQQSRTVFCSDLDGKMTGRIKSREYGQSGFLSIRDLEAYENGVLVSDDLQRQIYFLKPGTKQVEFIESTMPVSFRPGKICTEGSDRIYVADALQPAVYCFGAEGRLLWKRNLGNPELNDEGFSGIDASRGHLYLVSQKTGEVIELSSSIKRLLKLRGRKGSYLPFDLKVDGKNLIVADPIYQEVIVFDASGKEVLSFGHSVAKERRLHMPVGIDVSGSLIFVADRRERSVTIWKASF